jgi:23S rRNA (guanine2445-N2)-methyltransferase / 23S rRNA (guanine2069-N7)-methyltransferase
MSTVRLMYAASGHDAALWATLLDEARARQAARLGQIGPIVGFDLDPDAVHVAWDNIERAGLRGVVHVERCDISEASAPAGQPGLFICNPPYGERLPLPRAGALFRRLGDWMVQRCGGWRAAILAADTPAMTQLGLRPSHRIPLVNGPIPCRLLELTIRERAGSPPPPPSPPSLPPPPSQVEGRGESSVTGSLGAAAASRDRCEDAEPWRFRPEEVRRGEPGGGERSGRGNSYRPGADGANDEAVASSTPSPGRPRARTTADQIGDFRRRLAKRFKHLAKWARRQGIEAFRVYDRDIPEIPLVIDWYAGWLHAAEYERPHERTEIEHDVWLDRMIEAAALELGVPPNQTFLKVRKRQRGGDQYEKVDARRAVLGVREGGLEFEVNLSDYLDTGLFLDHRQTRALVRAEAEGRRFLNLFCYTGSFSVYAAAGGAKETTSVDLSNTYLDWTRTNLSKNGFKDAGRHRIIRDEARAFLEHRTNRGEPPFELVVVDPPTFSRSAKSETPWDVEQDHAALLELVARNLSPGGVVYFSTNFRRFHLAEEQLARLYTIREITSRTIPEDFRNERIHRAWRLVARPPV